LGITLLALPFLWIGCVGTLVFPFIMGPAGRSIWDALSPALIHSRSLALAITVLVILVWFCGYVLYAFLGFGLWKLRSWALKVALVLNILGVVVGVVACILTLIYQPLMALPLGIGLIAPYAFVAWYLGRPHVRAAFGTGSPITPLAEPVAVLQSPQLRPKAMKLWVKVVLGLAACAVLFGLFAASLFYAVEASFRQSDVYAMTMERARNSPCIAAKLGSALVSKGMIEGSISASNGEGTADLSIPVRGPKGEGGLDVSATKTGGRWTITSLTLLDDEGQIHLLPEPSPCQ
jgi:hypothetical protein